MQQDVAQRLNEMNCAFYKTVAESFSQTRQSAWAGWNICLHEARLEHLSHISMLDVACGNQRFADFASRVFPQAEITYIGVDNNAQLPDAYAVHHECDSKVSHLDVVKAALADNLKVSLENDILESRKVDMAVCFGFMHHIPTFEARVKVLEALIECCRPGGYICVSFWRFMNDTRLSRKAERDTERGLQLLGILPDDLDANDYLLGWKEEEGAYRYCHHFTLEELSALADAVADHARLIKEFQADGRTSTLNGYLMLQRW